MKISKSTLLIFAIIIALALAVIATFTVWITSKKKTTLVVTTGGSSGTYYAFAKALETVVNDNSRDYKIRLKVKTSNGANENAQLISSGQAHLGLIQGDTLGRKENAHVFGVKILARLFPEAFHLIVKKDSDIKAFSDLKGRRIAIPAKTSGSSPLFEDLSQHYELNLTEANLVRGNLNKISSALKDGTVDAMFVVLAVGNDKIRELMKDEELRFIPFSQARAISISHPSLRVETLPIGIYNGRKPIPAQNIKTLYVDSLLAVNSNVKEKDVRELTAIIFENRQKLASLVPLAKYIAQPEAIHSVHKGARNYYNGDSPPFFVEYAEAMAFALSLILLLWQGSFGLKNLRKNKADKYNNALVDIMDRIEDAGTIEEFDDIRSELKTMLQLVLVDLDKDRIEEKSMQSFSFAWDTAMSMLNYKQTHMNGQ